QDGLKGLDVPVLSTLRRKGAEVSLDGESETAPQPPAAAAVPAVSAQTRVITQPVRGGQQIYAAGDLIVLAPVSAGAEVLADGHIH
ncbi:septum site-determining protein MinC, partial [Acinetobacter baumannii]